MKLNRAIAKWRILDLESLGEPHNVEFMTFIKDKSSTASIRVSWLRWAKHLSQYFMAFMV